MKGGLLFSNNWSVCLLNQLESVTSVGNLSWSTRSLPPALALPGTGALIIRIIGSPPVIEAPIDSVPVSVPGRKKVPTAIAVHLDGPCAPKAIGVVAAVVLVDHYRTPPAVVAAPVAVVVGVVGVEIHPAAVVVPRSVLHSGIARHAARQQHQTPQQSEKCPGSVHGLLSHHLIDYRHGRTTSNGRMRDIRAARCVARISLRGFRKLMLEGSADVLVGGHGTERCRPSGALRERECHVAAAAGRVVLPSPARDHDVLAPVHHVGGWRRVPRGGQRRLPEQLAVGLVEGADPVVVG